MTNFLTQCASFQFVLTGGVVTAGDFDVTLSGIYGDDLPLPETNRELIPLMKKIIELLEEGAPVMVSNSGQVVSGGTSYMGGAGGGNMYLNLAAALGQATQRSQGPGVVAHAGMVRQGM